MNMETWLNENFVEDPLARRIAKERFKNLAEVRSYIGRMKRPEFMMSGDQFEADELLTLLERVEESPESLLEWREAIGENVVMDLLWGGSSADEAKARIVFFREHRIPAGYAGVRTEWKNTTIAEIFQQGISLKDLKEYTDSLELMLMRSRREDADLTAKLILEYHKAGVLPAYLASLPLLRFDPEAVVPLFQAGADPQAVRVRLGYGGLLIPKEELLEEIALLTPELWNAANLPSR